MAQLVRRQPYTAEGAAALDQQTNRLGVLNHAFQNIILHILSLAELNTKLNSNATSSFVLPSFPTFMEGECLR